MLALAPPHPGRGRRVTILKPLHGDEPGLYENLLTRSADQDYPGPVQIVFGVADPSDAAIASVERLRAAFPGRAIELVVDPRAAGRNPKIANLINMSPRIAHDIVVLADSDIRVRRDYLSASPARCEPSGGAVTCLYYGISQRRACGRRLARLSIDCHFLPGAVVGARSSWRGPVLARPSRCAGQRSRPSAASRRSPTASPTIMRSASRARARRPVTVLPVRGRPCLQRIVARRIVAA